MANHTCRVNCVGSQAIVICAAAIMLPELHLTLSLCGSSFISKVTGHSLPQPTFYQKVTNLIFEDLVRSALPVQTDKVSKAAAILYEDANIIHYTAGYVSQNIQQNSTLKSAFQARVEQVRDGTA